MNPRIQKLRDSSLQAVPTLNHERAELITAFYKSGDAQGKSVPVQRALAFRYLMLNKKVCIGDGELIVGERGPGPKATPSYPEVCLHSLDDLRILHDRPKVPFKSGEVTRRAYLEEIIPFWRGKTQRERIFNQMDQAWKDAYGAGIFTEFQEQRAPGHTVLGDKIYRQGFNDLRMEIEHQLKLIDFDNDTEALAKQEQLKAMDIAAETLIFFAARYASELERLAENEVNEKRKAELLHMAKICRKVPANRPNTLHEALQYYWFVHLGVISELNPWDSFNPGRLDQHLYPFFRHEIENGLITRAHVYELLQAFWIKFNNHPAPPKIGVTAKESNTYTDFALINVGGLSAGGEDAVNELSYIILDVVEEMRILQPSSMVQVSRKNPDELLKRAVKIIKTGFGQPSIFNTDAIVKELTRQGKSIEDARNGGASGCVESGAFGAEAYFLSGYFNLPKVLEVTLHNGRDSQTGKQVGPETGDPADMGSMEELLEAFDKQLNHFLDIKIKGNNRIEKLYAQHLPAPFLSLLIDDCIKQAKDYNAGGARYNVTYIQGVGLGSITDMLASIQYHVFDRRGLSMGDLLAALRDNFKGWEPLRKELIYNTPKYGNDDDYADRFAVEVFNRFFNAVDGRENARGGTHRINMLPTTSHVYFGSVIGATPDGRLTGEPLSEGISPVQGADRKGPTAVLLSASKFDHLKTGGTLLNQKFNPQLLDSDKGLESLVSLIRAYFGMNGHHIQFNVIDAETLRDAKRNPEKYRDLIVRVAGFSDYFNDLTPQLQDEIIRRTEHMDY
jgi:formate C-acetyltransferase